MAGKKWLLSMEQQVVVCMNARQHSSFLGGLACLMSAYFVFNMEYEVEAEATLEFIQRYQRDL